MDILQQKLKLKPDSIALVINKPETINFEGIRIDSSIEYEQYSFILFFAESRSDIDIYLPTLAEVATHNTVFWVAYPKKSYKQDVNISRDQGWEILHTIGYTTVSQISLTEQWSALRIKPVDQVKSNENAKHQTFSATIEGAEDNSGGAWVNIPFDTKKVFGKKGQVKVKATFDGHPYQGSIANMGTGSHILIVKKDIRKAIGKDVGDKVVIMVEQDTAKREVQIPEELQQLLDTNSKLKTFYSSLSYTNQKEYANWISSAKREETKLKRLNETERRLNEGIKNPFTK